MLLAAAPTPAAAQAQTAQPDTSLRVRVRVGLVAEPFRLGPSVQLHRPGPRLGGVYQLSVGLWSLQRDLYCTAVDRTRAEATVSRSASARTPTTALYEGNAQPRWSLQQAAGLTYGQPSSRWRATARLAVDYLRWGGGAMRSVRTEENILFHACGTRFLESFPLRPGANYRVASDLTGRPRATGQWLLGAQLGGTYALVKARHRRPSLSVAVLASYLRQVAPVSFSPVPQHTSASTVRGALVPPADRLGLQASVLVGWGR